MTDTDVGRGLSYSIHFFSANPDGNDWMIPCSYYDCRGSVVLKVPHYCGNRSVKVGKK